MKKWLMLLMMTFVFMVSNAQNISGRIVDASTGDSIPYASAIYKGHNVMVSSDAGGCFNISRHNGWYLTFSAVGYKPKKIFIKNNMVGFLIIELEPSEANTLEGVTVRSKRNKYSRKNNPAVELMKRVIEAKKRTDLNNHDFYQFNKYQKITLAFNDIKPSELESDFFQKKKWMLNHVEPSPYTGKLILPISVDETVTKRVYRKSPRSEKDIIIGQSTTGISELIETGDILNSVLKDIFTDVDIYDDQVRLLQHPFTSPIGKNAIGFYRFYIEDTVYVANDLCYHLQFLPNNQQDFGFRGELYIIADSTLHVKRCNLTIPIQSDVNFVDNLQIMQEYTKLPNGEWALSVDDMFVELSLTSFLSKAVVMRTTRLNDYAFDEIPKKLFKGKGKERREADAMMRNKDFWAQYRAVDLTKSEGSMDDFVRGLENMKGFKYIIFGAKALIENFVETGNKKHPSKVDIGPINTMITRNFVDGMRTRASAQTTANTSKHWFLSGYYAHGWQSKKNYYKGELTYSFNKKEYLPREYPRRTLSFSSTYDVCTPSDKFIKTDKDNVFTAFKWGNMDKMMFYNRQQLAFEYEIEGGLKLDASLKAEENEATANLFFTPMNLEKQMPDPNVTEFFHGHGKLRTTELSFGVRFAPGETFINTKQRRVPINLDAPIFTLSHTIGIKGFLGGDYTYHFSEATIFKRFWLNSWGKMDIRLKGGIQWSKVPFPLLIVPAANLSYIVQKETFNLINNMEFLNDRYASLSMSWDMNGKIFNRIPLIHKLKWREYIGVKCLWGYLSEKNNPLLEQNAGDPNLMYFPEGVSVMDMNRPYVELVAGIHNIFKLLHVEYVRRLTYLDPPTAHKHGIRFMLQMTF
ncbi:DUF5686 family protein [Prevotella koreensis]|uniref:DUF5686 and carboxypeptidase-like regulatory domain-containing protein n=1 Tax=Prevotella koreensis TaxID=2490854 RepID=UPI0028EBD2B0|nr:DUF5686 family protein [Prevotella koreensis]